MDKFVMQNRSGSKKHIWHLKPMKKNIFKSKKNMQSYNLKKQSQPIHRKLKGWKEENNTKKYLMHTNKSKKLKKS